MDIMDENDLREERYAHLRIRKARCEKTFTLCLAAQLLFAAVEVMTIGTVSSVERLGQNLLLGCVSFAVNLGIVVCSVLGICKRNRYLTIAALVLWAAACFQLKRFYYYGTAACLIITLSTEFEWEKLRHKEGFPLFDIPIREKETKGTLGDLTVRNLPPPSPETAGQDGERQFTPGEMDSI